MKISDNKIAVITDAGMNGGVQSMIKVCARQCMGL